MTNKLELLLQAGCTGAQVKKYERHQDERKVGKTPCPDLRRNYNTCNGRLEVFLRELAKQDATCPRKRQANKNACVWAQETARCLADHTAHLPEGYITFFQLFQEELFNVYVNEFERADGTTTFLKLDYPDVQRRGVLNTLFEEIEGFYSDVLIPVNFNGPKFAADLRARLGNMWDDSINADRWEVGYSQGDFGSGSLFALPVEWVRNTQFRKEVRNEIIQTIRENYPSAK